MKQFNEKFSLMWDRPFKKMLIIFLKLMKNLNQDVLAVINNRIIILKTYNNHRYG
mgnify:CR=1 FL=1